jgi:type I restriction enzyme, S subunit
MVGEERRSTLGDYFTLQRGTTYKSRLLGQPGPVLLGLATIQRNGGFRTDSLQTYGGESPDKLLVLPGELYVSLKDVTQSADLLGAVARLPYGQLPGRLTQDTVKLEPKSDDVPLDYLYWLLRTPQYRAYCRAHATGTTNLGLSREDFLAFPIPEPTSNQLMLVETLDMLDNKIEMNRQMNQTLEGMAQALFKSWFVDFDPVTVKAAGRKPYGMNEATAAIFPSRFMESDLGLIPEGWRVGRLDDLLILQRGFDLPATQRREGGYPVLAASGFSGTHDEFKVKAPGVTTGRSGLIGKVFFVHEDFWPLNTSLWIKEFRISRPAHAYHLLKELDFETFNAGSAVPTLNRNHVHNLQVVIPSPSVIEIFEKLGMMLFQKCHANEKESLTLASLRDALLPKLLSDEIRGSQVEKMVAEAV